MPAVGTLGNLYDCFSLGGIAFSGRSTMKNEIQNEYNTQNEYEPREQIHPSLLEYEFFNELYQQAPNNSRMTRLIISTH
ncbi:hypothetical protein ANRL2_03483 [Anaerolineae bacterium]|nr:hypothetical protein ANRL2_03483 [Anaerolineae bacterium]